MTRPGKSRQRIDLINRAELLEHLKPIEYTGGSSATKEEFEKLNLTDMLLVLAEISHLSEYELCGKVAQHLLGSRPDVAAETT
jgi:hypothetical protein